MRTIGRRYPGRKPNGDYRAMCDYCGADFYRRKLTRDEAGFLACKDDRGRPAITLDRLNAAATGRRGSGGTRD